MLNLASCYQATGKYKESELLLKDLLDEIESASGLDLDATSAPRVLSSLALTKQYLGDFDYAENTFRRSLVIKEGKLGRDEIDAEQKINLQLVSALDLNALGRLDCKRRRYASAEEQIKLSITRLEALDKSIDPNRELWSEFAMAMLDVLIATDRADLALELAQSILNVRLNCLTPEHPSMASAYDAFGRCLVYAGDLAKAQQELEKARRIRAKSMDSTTSDNAETIFSLALLATKKGEAQAADALYQLALDLKEKAYGKSYPDVAEILESYQIFLKQEGRTEEAAQASERASEIRAKFD